MDINGDNKVLGDDVTYVWQLQNKISKNFIKTLEKWGDVWYNTLSYVNMRL